MAIYNNDRLVIKACKLFYQEDKSQKEIAEIIGISKPQVSRMLSYAKAQNLVEFTIKNPYSQEFELEEKLLQKFSLKEAYVFQYANADQPESVENLGEHCAMQLDKYFSDHLRIGVMSGRTIAATAAYAHRLTRSGMQFIPLIGGIGSTGSAVQANLIAAKFAEKTGSSYDILNAPVIMQSVEACEIIKQEPTIARVLDKAKTCQIALVGIGAINTASSTYRYGAYNQTELEELKVMGAVASICTSYLDHVGKIIETPLSRRSIGLSIAELSKCHTIAIAADPDKIPAVTAALKSGFIDVFMTSVNLAKKLV